VLANLLPALLAISQPVASGIYCLRHSVVNGSTDACVRCLGRRGSIRDDDMSGPDSKKVPKQPSNAQVRGPHTKDEQSGQPSRALKSPLPEPPAPCSIMTGARLAAWIESLQGEQRLYFKLVHTFADAAKAASAAKDRSLAFDQGAVPTRIANYLNERLGKPKHASAFSAAELSARSTELVMLSLQLADLLDEALREELERAFRPRLDGK
jgi:hypothetical protein